MPFDSWDAFYHSDLQSPIALCVLPFAFLVARAAFRPEAARALVPAADAFVARYALIFALLTILDPICTGPLSRALGISGSWTGTIVMFSFVLLGDYRVLALVFGLAAKTPAAGLRRAIGWTFIVPVVAGALYGVGYLAAGGLEMKWLWLVYELGFASLSLFLARRWLPENLADERSALRGYLQSLLAYVLAYYVLWATADVLLLFGLDEGWAIRVIPNQLYYAGFVPFAVWRFYRSAAS